ncbi:MAG: ATPase, T2SS/T4P/T4SS family, partial [Patescibacteria group bacterium]|nr:ATPase, T2SS/T4P/T4SS family [Patescibacteria group bacterium]
MQLIRRHLKLQAGLIVVAGPTGSGKTTTLYAMLNELNSGTRKIITIEDPVEYRFEGISQFQVNEKNGLTFSELLKRVLRHDPDIIMVGEIRDHETASLCIQAAQTGHMVLGTIHAKSCGGVVTRFLNLGVTNKDLASSLSLIISQRLVKSRDNRRLGVFSIMPITVRLADLIAKGVSEHELELAAFDDGFISLYKKAKILEKEGLI